MVALLPESSTTKEMSRTQLHGPVDATEDISKGRRKQISHGLCFLMFSSMFFVDALLRTVHSSVQIFLGSNHANFSRSVRFQNARFICLRMTKPDPAILFFLQGLDIPLPQHVLLHAVMRCE